MQTPTGSSGNLYIKLNYSIPTTLTDEQKELISKLKGNK